MSFENETQAINLLKKHNINVSKENYVLYPKTGFFSKDIYNAINYLVDECNMGLKYVDVKPINITYEISER